jgi:hypothetical protein
VAPHDLADAHDLVGAARDLIRIDDPRTAGLWPRGAAILARQSVEASMEDLWRLRSPGMRRMTARCQLLCLGDFIHDPELAGRVSVTWHGLSRACHVRVYELPPSLEELHSWLDCAWRLAEAVAAQRNIAAANVG